MKTMRSPFLAFLLFLVLTSSVNAQSAPSSSVTTNNASGVMPYSLYGGARENINLATGNMNLQVPLMSLPGRAGHDLNLGLTYDSKNWNLTYHYDEYGNNWYEWYAEERPLPAGGVGWRINTPFISSSERCTNGPTKYVYDTDFIVTLPDGSRHSFKNKDNTYRRPNGCDNAYQQVPYPSLDQPIKDSEDGSFMRLDTGPSDHAILHMKDGTRIYFYGTTFTYGSSPSSAKVIDANGNIVTYAFSGSWQLASITDTVGRAVTFTYVSGALSQLTYKDSSGTNRNISFAYQSTTISPTFSQPAGAAISPPTSNGMLSAITLPNNRTYSFTYNNFGELTQVTYPTGGYTKYEYGTFYAWHQVTAGSTTGDFREITARRVCPKETSCTAQEEHVTTYTPTIQGTWSNNSSTQVIDPLGNKNVHTFTYNTTYGLVAGPRELTRQVYEGTSTLLRTIQTDYTGAGDERFPIRVTTTLETGQVSKVEWDYGTYTRNGVPYTIDNVTEQRDYDYGNVAKRKAKFTYLKVNPINGQNYDSTTIFILNRKTKQEVYDWNGTTETQKAKTEWEYDCYSTGCSGQALEVSGTVQHDSAYGTGYTSRGNVTATLVWRDNPTATLTTRNQFDDAGNIRKNTDPLGHPTTFSYTDSWANTTCQPTGGSAKAYLTSVTNALNHITTSTYNSCSGTVSSTTDPNSQTATFSYDLMNRIIQTNLPGGGQSTRTFNEASVPLSLTSTTKITASMNLVATVTVDGLGREVLSSLDSDPEGVTRTKAEYDALGRKKRAYSPTRCNPVETNCGESTWGYTENVYDGLGRVIKVRPPDGMLNPDSNIITTSYSGNTVTVTDQAGKKRKSESDALGRLIRVWEPDAAQALVHITRYQYDVLDNLLCVHQKSTDATADKACGDATVPATWRERRFTYNSLSQLLTAYNPESGSISYAYDNDGNLTTKTDARSITTTHGYDQLHRLTGKTYSDGTPTATFTYDVASVDGLSIQYPVGRLVKAATTTTRKVNNYDALGRITTQWQCTPLNCGTTWYTLTYGYDLASNVTSSADGAGHTFTQGFNAAARITQLTSSLNDAQHPGTLVSGITYTPAASLAQMTLGNGLAESRAYNSRLQPTEMRTYNPSTQADTLRLTYGFVDASGKNNGNVMSWSATGQQAFTRAYTYDELNRLKTMTWSQCNYTWYYDIWGNRSAQDATGGTGPCGEHFPTITTSNRISELGYDAAGNVTSDGPTTYQYDAENRMKSINGGGSNPEYTYDANGRRVRKKASGVTTEYVYDLAGSVVAEFQGTTWTKGYVSLGGQLVAQYDNTVSPATTYFVHKDHLGSSRVLTKVDKSVQDSLDFLPYGEQVSGDTATSHKFTSKERDTESGLDYFGFRYYSQSSGRWRSPDLINLTRRRLTSPGNTLNKYTYAADNPLLFIDPAGLDITVFYRAPSSGGDTGHLLIAAVNQQTGQVRFLDYYPASDPKVGVSSDRGVINQGMNEKRLGEHAALTIQTTPEVAQKLIDYIDSLENYVPDYWAPQNNCVSICREALIFAGLDIFDPIGPNTPTAVWSGLFARYSPGFVFPGYYQYQPGVDFGRPFSVLPQGTDPFHNLDILRAIVKNERERKEKKKEPPKACVTTYTDGKKVQTTCS